MSAATKMGVFLCKVIKPHKVRGSILTVDENFPFISRDFFNDSHGLRHKE